MTSKNKCQTSDAIDFNPPNAMVHSPPQTVRTGSLHRMLVAHTLLLLLTTEARRAQRNFIFCPIGSPAYSAGQASDRANREPTRRVGLQAKRGEKNTALRAGSRESTWIWKHLVFCQRSFRRRRRLFSLAAVSRPGKKPPSLCPLCLCGSFPFSVLYYQLCLRADSPARDSYPRHLSWVA